MTESLFVILCAITLNLCTSFFGHKHYIKYNDSLELLELLDSLLSCKILDFGQYGHVSDSVFLKVPLGFKLYEHLYGLWFTQPLNYLSQGRAKARPLAFHKRLVCLVTKHGPALPLLQWERTFNWHWYRTPQKLPWSMQAGLFRLPPTNCLKQNYRITWKYWMLWTFL